MPTLQNFADIEDSAMNLSKIKPPLVIFYTIIILFACSAIVSLFYIKTDKF